MFDLFEVKPVIEREGWFYSKKFNHLQKTKGRVFAYVSPMTFGATKAQLYLRGPHPTCCTLEVRSATDRELVFRIAEQWLEEFQSGDIDLLQASKYYVWNPNGIWNDGIKGWI